MTKPSMSGPWIHPQEPVRKAVNFNFKAYIPNMQLGEEREDTLCSLEHSAGDWTLYLIRQLPDNFPVFTGVAEIREIRVQVGYGEAQDDQLLTTINQTPPAFFAWGGRNRAQMLHYHGSTVQARVKWRAPLTPMGEETDALVCWISPSRPAAYEVPFIATMEAPVLPAPLIMTSPPMRIPIWAQTLTPAGNALDLATGNLVVPAPFWACWFDWADTPAAVGPGATLVTPGATLPIPTDARFVRFVRPVGGAPALDFVSGVFNCRS